MEVQRMFDNLLNSIDWAQAAKCSYTAFHAPGLSYLNLLRTERLTVKLYTFENVERNPHGWVVWPHNHSYNFTHRTMVGKIWNHKFELDAGSDSAGIIRAKVWPRDEPEPAEWTIEVRDPHVRTHGAAGVYAFTPQSRFSAYIDNLSVTPNE